MFPYLHLSGVPSGAVLDMTAEFAPLFIGMVVLLGVCALGLAFDALTYQYQTWAQGEAQREVVYRKRFFCPTKAREVEVDFLARMDEPENLLEVKRCSAFKRAEKIDCDRSCLYLPQAREAPPIFFPPLLPLSFPW